MLFMRQKRLTFAIAVACSMGVGFATAADDGAPASPRFAITAFKVEGGALLPDAEIQRRVAPFVGERRDFGDVQRALEAVEAAYAEAGWGGIQVLLPEQRLEGGVVRLQVIESRIGKITVEGQRHFGEDNIRASVPALQVGQVPRPRDMQESLRLANENPAKQTALVLRAGEREGELEAALKVVDRPPERLAVSLDNSGSRQTGDYRLAVGYQDANFLGRDHVLNVQAMTSPTKYDKVLVAGVGYRIPLYGSGDAIDLAAGYSNADAGTMQDLFAVSGAGSIYSARYTTALPRWAAWEPKLSFGLDVRDYRNRVRTLGGDISVVPDISVHPASLTFSLVSRGEGGETGMVLGYSRNLPGGDKGDAAAFEAARAGADSRYSIWRWGISHLGNLPANWQWRAALNGQVSRDALVPGEQFGLGGTDSIRGFHERELASDRGHRGSVEVYTPDVGASMGLAGTRLRGLVFYDFGQLRRNRALAGEALGESVASYGLGLRAGVGSQMSLRLDFGIVADPGGNQGRNDGRLHASFAYQF